LKIIKQEIELDQINNPQHPLHVAIGYATTHHYKNIDELLKKADQIMYQDKQAYYLLNTD
ncbi:MAG: diguanylate cyclase, partial [Acinetobacter sp.]|nr:diguanylate cyclase [Acinetobacter sp.]